MFTLPRIRFLQMEFTTETVEVEEICEDGTIHRNTETSSLEDGTVKYVINWPNATSDDSSEKVVTDGEEATIITYQFDMGEATECVELPTTEVKQTQRAQVAVKSNPPKKQINTSATFNKNNRGTKRPVKTLDPNMPAFVCTEHEDNFSLECRYCRIAAGVKKKGIPKTVQNNEITSSGGKVTVAIPKRDASCVSVNYNNYYHVQNN